MRRAWLIFLVCVVPDGTCIAGNSSNFCQGAQLYCCL